MPKLIIVISTLAACYWILRITGVFEFTGEHRKVVSNIDERRNKARKSGFISAFLGLGAGLANLFRGILLSERIYDTHNYYIKRLDIRSNSLNRQLTVEELRGVYFMPFAFSLILIPVILFRPWFLFINIFCLLVFLFYPTIYEGRIRDEDEIIDNYFMDMYLLMYSKLKQGSRARLQGVIQNYIDTLEGQGNGEVKRVMLKFSQNFLNLLNLYEDHQAVPKLKELYHSATVINFCNVATQSLNGIENFDNLITFKMQLVERKTEMMRKNSAMLVRKGELSIYAIYIILFIFIAVGWYSKLPKGFF